MLNFLRRKFREALLLPPISVSLKRERMPEFRREYKTYVTTSLDTYRVEINFFSWRIGLRERPASGTIYQSNGSSVSFNPRHIAIKILDRELAPLVENVSWEILRQDAEWYKNETNSFTDETGTVWRKD